MGVKKIKTADPRLQTILDSASREFREQENKVFYLGEPTKIQVERFVANFGQMVLCDPTTAGFTVVLPEIDATKIGKLVVVVNVTSSTNTITIKPEGSAYIKGNTSDTITTAYGYRLYVAVSTSEWVK